jgi:hypothetical protein
MLMHHARAMNGHIMHDHIMQSHVMHSHIMHGTSCTPMQSIESFVRINSEMPTVAIGQKSV